MTFLYLVCQWGELRKDFGLHGTVWELNCSAVLESSTAHLRSFAAMLDLRWSSFITTDMVPFFPRKQDFETLTSKLHSFL